MKVVKVLIKIIVVIVILFSIELLLRLSDVIAANINETLFMVMIFIGIFVIVIRSILKPDED